MLHTKQKAFTLVELIVVVTILAILATIGFVSYSSYLTGVRDTNRLAQLVSISDWLELYRTKNNLPLPDYNVEVQANGTIIAYQWYAGSNTLETIDFTKWWKDPRDDSYFSYYLTKDRKYFQLMWFLEESENLSTINWIKNSLISQTHAVNYIDRIPTVYGKKLWILTDVNNTPIQEVSTITSAGLLDVLTTTDTYKAYFKDNNIFEGTWAELEAKIQLHINYNSKFSPKSVWGLFMWFDATDPDSIEKDSSNIISKWKDKSGNNNHFDIVEWDPSYGDYKINWQKTVYFDGTDSLKTTSTFDAPYTIMYVAQMEGSQNYRVLWWSYNTLLWFHDGSKNDVYMNWWIYNPWPTTFPAWTETELFTFSRDTSNASSFYTSWEKITLTAETIWNGNFGNLRIWWTWPSWNWPVGNQKSKVQIWEVLIFDTVISNDNRLKIESYLNTKWWPF